MEESPIKFITLVILLLPLRSLFEIFTIHISYYIAEVQCFRGTLKTIHRIGFFFSG